MKLINSIATMVGYMTAFLFLVMLGAGVLAWIMMVLGGAIGTAWNIERLSLSPYEAYLLVAIVIVIIGLFNLGSKK